jgi:hypothetical protein
MTTNNTTPSQPILSNLVTISQYVKKRNELGGKKLYETKVRQLIADGIIKTIDVAGKHLIDWSVDGDLEIDGPVVSIQRVAAQKERREDKKLAEAINNLAALVKERMPIKEEYPVVPDVPKGIRYYK